MQLRKFLLISVVVAIASALAAQTDASQNTSSATPAEPDVPEPLIIPTSARPAPQFWSVAVADTIMRR